MAMKFNRKDESVIIGLCRTGSMTESHLKSLGYTDSRIKNRSCGEQKLIERIGRDCKTGENVYRLTEAGKEQGARLGIDRADQYRGQGKEKTMNFQHDRKLADVYCSLREEERDMWKTEEQYKREIEEVREHIRVHEPERWESEVKDVKMTAFDGGYVDAQGQEHYIEVITESYDGKMIASKEASAEMLGGSYNSYNA